LLSKSGTLTTKSASRESSATGRGKCPDARQAGQTGPIHQLPLPAPRRQGPLRHPIATRTGLALGGAARHRGQQNQSGLKSKIVGSGNKNTQAKNQNNQD
jgi:hypothetical protein